ncbi:MAG: hypothetical protein IJ053_03720 [Lachnospiraceae bacterium]|nr:hypothetical protein [Lachnospiraceae bacterium]
MKLKKFIATVVCVALLVVGSGIPYPTAKAEETDSDDVVAAEDELVQATKLDAPSKPEWLDTGSIVWDAVEGAGWYTIYLYKDNDTEPVKVISTKQNEIESRNIYGIGLSYFSTLGGGTYTVKISASIGEVSDSNTDSDLSDMSEPFECDITKFKLDTPKNPRWEGTTCVWDAVDEAGGYQIEVTKDGNVIDKKYTATLNSSDLYYTCIFNYGAGKYSFKVRATRGSAQPTIKGESDWSVASAELDNSVVKTIKFNANGGSGTMADLSIGKYQNDFSVPECQFTAPEGKQFYGWKYMTSDGFYDFAYPMDSRYIDSLENEANIEFTAVWENAGTVYNIEWDGVTVGKVVEGQVIYGSPVPTGDNVYRTCAGEKIIIVSNIDSLFAPNSPLSNDGNIPDGKYVKGISYTGIDSGSEGFEYNEYDGSSPILSFIMPANDVKVSAVYDDTTNYTIDLSSGSTTISDIVFRDLFNSVDLRPTDEECYDIDNDGTPDIKFDFSNNGPKVIKLDSTNLSGSFKLKTIESARPKYYYTIVLNKPGEIENTTSTSENFASASLANSSEELKKTVLTAEEQKLLEEGVDIQIWLDVDDVSASVPVIEKTAIDAAKPEGFIVGTFFDINLFKKIGDKATTKVTDVPNGNVKIQINVPKDLQKSGRKYSIIRLHDGKATVLDTAQDGYVLTFETNQFSTYALVYSDVTATPTEVTTPSVDTPKVTNNQSPKTGDNMPVGFMVVLMISSLIIIIRLKIRLLK